MERTRKVMVGIVVLALLVLLVVSSALIFPSEPPATKGQSIPWIFGCSPPTTMYNLPINQTEVTNYVKNVLKNYYNLVESREGQAGNLATIQHFFPLYAPVGQTFNVYVARDNQSQTNDMIEFFFAPIPGTEPNVTVYTHQTGAELRGVETICPDQPVRLDYDISTAQYWTILSDVSTNSPLGVNYFPIIWITNMSAVFNDPNGGANAAQTIYNNEHTVYLQSLSVPFPSWAWLGDTLKQLWDVFVALTAIMTAYEFYLHIRDWRASEHSRVRRPRS